MGGNPTKVDTVLHTQYAIIMTAILNCRQRGHEPTMIYIGEWNMATLKKEIRMLMKNNVDHDVKFERDGMPSVIAGIPFIRVKAAVHIGIGIHHHAD